MELYDIVADPYEKVDLAANKPDVVAKLSRQLAEWKSTLPAQPDADCLSADRPK